MSRTIFVTFTAALVLLFVSTIPLLVQGHGNAEVKHQQLITEQLQKPSMQEKFETYLAKDDNIRLIAKKTMHNAIHDDPALTMECKKMAEAREMTCCNTSDVKENNRNGQKRGNAEVRHQQLIAEQLQQPSIQDMFTNFLAADENIPLMVMESIHNAMQDDPALTMECGLMAEYSEIACCSLAKAEKDNEHRDHH